MFRRHEEGCAHHVARARECGCRAQHFGDPEVGEQQTAVTAAFEQHVFRLDVAVDDVAAVGIAQSVGGLAQVAPAELDAQLRRLTEDLTDAGPRHVRHREDVEAVPLRDLVYGHYVGMGQLRGHAAFTLEALHDLGMVGQSGRQHFQRHAPIESGLVSQIHAAHATPPQFPDDPELALRRRSDSIE